MEQTPFDKVIEATNRYNKDLVKYQSKKLNWQQVIYLGDNFGKLSEYLGGSTELYMRQGIWNKAVKGHTTHIDLNDLRDLPLKLYQAPLIFKSKKPNSIVVALNVTDDAKQPVVVAIDMASTSNGRNVANMATSIHGRPMEHLLQWQEQGLVLHNGVQKENSIFLQMFDTIPNLEKNRDLEKKFTCSEQPGTIPSVETSKEFNNTAKVVQNFETTKSFAEKMSDLTKKNTEKFRKPMNNNNLDRGKSL